MVPETNAEMAQTVTVIGKYFEAVSQNTEQQCNFVCIPHEL